MNAPGLSLRDRIERVRDRVDIVALIGKVVTLSRSKKPRGKCPLHGSKSDSFEVNPKAGFAKCYGCQWYGDAIKWLVDYYGLEWIDALRRLEEGAGLADLTAAPAKRAKVDRPAREVTRVESLVMGRHIWMAGEPDYEAVRTYLRSRKVPEAMLLDHRLADIRFTAKAPILAWPIGKEPSDVPQAPAMVALIRRVRDWQPIGAHVTFLRPDLKGKMKRKYRNGDDYPDRKMCGSAWGGAVLLPGAGSDIGGLVGGCALYVGEGLETVLSGMALGEAGADACGLAALSLDNLQGQPALIRGALPLYDVRPHPGRATPIAFRHDGPVIGLIDADMSPKRGPRDPRSGEFTGEALIERKGARIVRRTVTTAERAAICGSLFVHGWRAQGCRARAVRPPMGQDFNDAVREGC